MFSVVYFSHFSGYTVILILISLMTNAVEHIFVCLLLIQILLCEVSVKIFHSFLTALFIYYCRSSLYALDTSPL